MAEVKKKNNKSEYCINVGFESVSKSMKNQNNTSAYPALSFESMPVTPAAKMPAMSTAQSTA